MFKVKNLGTPDSFMSKLEKAKADPRIVPLLTEVKSRCTIRFKKSDGDAWGSSLTGGVAQIDHTKTAYPAASLAHELLHIIVQLKGIKQIRIGIWTLDQTEMFNRFMKAINNELQHHRMFPTFISVGFTPSEFYCDSDTQIESHLRSTLANGVESLIELVPDFLTLLAPGGSISQSAKDELLEAFLNVNNRIYRDQLVGIRNEISTWASSNSFDNIPTIKQICLHMQNPCVAWFGFNDTDKPPNAGFFVGEQFEVEGP